MTDGERPPRTSRSGVVAALLSLVVPGSGQAYVGQRYHGGAVFLGMVVALSVARWHGVDAWYLVPAAMWLWNVHDAVVTAAGRKHHALPFVAALLVMGYGIGWQVTKIDLSTLFGNVHRAASILRPMLHPDFVTRVKQERSAWAPVEVPCGPHPAPAVNTVNGIHVEVAPDCGGLGTELTVHGTGLWPHTPTEIAWGTPIGTRLPLGKGFTTPFLTTTDSAGSLSASVRVPPDALASAPNPDLPLEHRVYLTQSHPGHGIRLSANGTYVLQGIVETIFLALMATTFGALAAIPVAFLAARNLMGHNRLTLAVYVATRTVLNVVRSVEPLIIAIVFVAIVGLGPFAGVIAITMHTIAALGKLYSEVIEGIDPGPLEAVRATGGSWAQVVRFAVIPQIVPAFASFTLFRWDINVRTSTIIGFVGGGGIGFFLYQWIIKGDFRAVGSSFIAIAVVVSLLDLVSARARAHMV